MNIVVCIKEVPREFQVDPRRKALIREGIKGDINPADKNAIELAVQLREKHGGRVTLFSMCPPAGEGSLLKGLAMGADMAILLCDPKFAGADTLATSYTVAAGIRKLGDFDLVICGNETSDSGTGQVPVQIAEHLGLPQIINVMAVEAQGRRLRVRRKWGEETQIVEANLPVLITVMKGINEPRLPSVFAIMEASQKPMLRWGAADLQVEEARVGSPGSRMRTAEIRALETRKQCEMLSGTAEDVVAQLVGKLQGKGILV